MFILKNIMNHFPDQPENTSITITNVPKSVLKDSTNHSIGIIYIIFNQLLLRF